MVQAGHKGQLKGEVKTVRVLRSRNGKIPPQAFSFCTEIRHVLVENGVKIVGEAAWRRCRQLQIVHLPDTVVSLLQDAFSRYQVLRVVVAPGCKYFGAKVFEECCSLTQVGAAHCPSNKLQFKNMCGHKCSPGVENKCLRRCKTMEKQRHGKLLSRTCRNNRTSCDFSPGDLKILPTKRPPFWGPKTDPKMEATHSVSI